MGFDNKVAQLRTSLEPDNAFSLKDLRSFCDILSTTLFEGVVLDPNSFQDPDLVLELAFKTKTLGLLKLAFESSEMEPSARLRETLQAIESNIVAKSFHNIAESIHVIDVLKPQGLEIILYKGSLRSQNVYGNWWSRTSSDVDLLVNEADYETAKRVLIDAGYKILVEPESQWWSCYLGELPFLSPRKNGAVVDLHKQVQQPGGPFPVDPKAFFAGAETVSFGNRSVKTLNQADAFLVSVISYGKAVRAGEPWVHTAHEICTVYLTASEDERASFAEVASRQSLGRLLDDAVSSSLTLFGKRSEVSALSDSRDEIIRLAFGTEKHLRFFRTRRLWTWLDGGPMKRALSFISGLIRVFKSEWVQKREVRSGLISGD